MRTASPLAPWRHRSRAAVTAALALPVVALAYLAPAAHAAAVTEVAFTGSSTWTVPANVTTVDVLVVGGGGGGGNFQSATGGGGGGGAVLVCTDIAVTEGQVLTATVGSGGTYTGSVGGAGGASSLALGQSPACSANGGAGGGGGQIAPYYAGGASGNGNAGGTTNNSSAGGGGGGAGGAGGNPAFSSPNWQAGAGGTGVTPASLVTPGLFADVTATFYGGGGGGGLDPQATGNAGAGGNGGGGAGGGRTPAASPIGVANTGGGGGGSGSAQSGSGGVGGSGYVAIRYVPVTPTPPPDVTPTPAVPTSTPTPTAAPTPSTVPTTPLALRGTTRSAPGTGRVTTTGPLPDGATSVMQTARTGATTRGFLETARAKTAKARCTVTGPTYRCTVVLTRGIWTVRTVATGPAGVVATSIRRVVVRAAVRPVAVNG